MYVTRHTISHTWHIIPIISMMLRLQYHSVWHRETSDRSHVFTLGRVLTISPAVTRVILSNHGLMLWTSGLCLALCAPVELIKRPANKKDCSVGVFSQCVRVYLREVACYGVVAPVRLSLNWGFIRGLDFNGTFPVKTILFYLLF